mgnify:CR=1 FL=1
MAATTHAFSRCVSPAVPASTPRALACSPSAACSDTGGCDTMHPGCNPRPALSAVVEWEAVVVVGGAGAEAPARR